MFCLYEHTKAGEIYLFGEYPTLSICKKITELRWDAMQQLGYKRAQFHCEKKGGNETVAAWEYTGGDEDVV